VEIFPELSPELSRPFSPQGFMEFQRGCYLDLYLDCGVRTQAGVESSHPSGPQPSR
jgi:hypothetical protein